MKTICDVTLKVLFFSLLLYFAGAPALPVYAQFDKLKKAAGGDKKKDKDKKEKKETTTDKSSTTGGKTGSGGNTLAGYDLTGYLGEPIKDDDQNVFIKRLKWGWDGSYSADDMYHIGVFKLIKNVQSDGLSDAKEARTFYQNYKKMNLEHTKKMIEAARKKWKTFDDDFMENDFKEYSAYYLNDFAPALQNCADGALSKEINKFIDKGAKLLKEGKANEALDNAEAADLLCQAVYEVIPNYAPIKELQADAQKILNTISAEKDKMFTGPVHKKFINKIVFSKKPIIAKQENEADFTNTFTATDNIYAMVYLNGTFGEMLKNDNVKTISVSVLSDGNPVKGSDKWYSECVLKRLPKDIAKQTYLEFEILPEVTTCKYPEAAKFIANAFASELSERKHTVTIGMLEDKITGEFKIDLTGGGATMQALVPKYEDARLSNMRMPPSTFTDKALETTILNLCKKASEFTSEGDVPLRVSLQENWFDEKDAWGNIILQYAQACVAYKSKSGQCHVIDVSVAQDYKGSGKYGPTRFYKRYSGSGDYDIKCENVMK